MIFMTGAQQLPGLSASDFQNLRNKLRDELWSGMLQAELAAEERVLFLFSGGALKCAYRLASQTAQRGDMEVEWSSLSNSSPVNAVSLSLSPSTLRLVKVILEHPAPAEALQVEPDRLQHVFDQWLQQAHPNLAVLNWTAGEGIVMLWPGSPVHSTAALVASGGKWEDDEAVKQMLSPDLGKCEAHRHALVSDGGAWEEYGFQHMFVRLLEAILTRYKELTGLALLNALDRNINRVAMENKWDLSIILGTITDRMFFRDLDEALAACKRLLEVACEHVGVVLGQKLSRALLQDAIASLDVHSIRIVEKYSIDAFLGSPKTVLAAEEQINA